MSTRAVRDVTFVAAYFENPGMLARQLAHFASLPHDLRKHLHAVITDDCSPQYPAEPAMGAAERRNAEQLASFQLFRVDEKRKWNWLTCRNIGVHHARTDWLLLTDIDHELPEKTARRILTGKLREENVYRFERVSAPDMVAHKIHPNTWLMTREMFDRIGGYDEEFSGFYGSDGAFRDKVNETANSVVILPEVMVRVGREVQPDASTTQFKRKTEADGDGIRAARERIAARPPGTPSKRLTFKYHRVEL